MFDWLKGKRTYIAASIGVVLTGLYGMGYIDSQTYQLFASFFAFIGLGFLRASIER